ncbi:MAG TPA: PKD domain-containing protein [Flavobacterium sp.]|jgi:PKD repeat protein
MKKYYIVMLGVLCGYSVNGQGLTKKVLFIGNSYTEVNNLPQIITNVASSVGDVLIQENHLPGGFTLLQHSSNNVTQGKIMEGGWDYVVLQGQSQEAVTAENNFYDGAESLNNLITQYNPCAVPMFYVTWGRKNGDAVNCPNVPVMCSYESMDTAITSTYLALAEYMQIEASPVSSVWKFLRQNYPSIELYQSDESHPSAAGSYAAACCFYAAIFKKDPTLITFDYSLSPADAIIIRNVAKSIVFNNLTEWDFKQMPVSDFKYTIGDGNNEVLFDNRMQNADNCLWDFGDGSPTSTALNPTHSYANNGTYTVTLTSSNCDLEGVHQDVMVKNISFCSHTPTISPANLLLCPQTSDMLWTEPADSYQWFQDGIPVPDATNQFFEVSASSDNSLFSVMTTTNNCSEFSRQTSVSLHQWLFGSINLTMVIEGNIFEVNKVCEGETITLTAGVTDEHFSQWYKDDVLIPFATGDSYVVSESGTYKVRIDHLVCPNMGSFSDMYMEPLQYEFVDCSLSNADTAHSLWASPNPVKNILTLQTKNTITEIRLYDLSGKGLRVPLLIGHSIDVSFLPQGMYIIKVKTTEDHYSIKFIKE